MAIEIQEDPAESPETLRRIAFRGKLVECLTVVQVESVGFLCDRLGMSEKSPWSAAAITLGPISPHPKEQLQAEMRSLGFTV